MHIPVLQKEVLEYLHPVAGENFIDCTMGEAGHSLAILEKIKPGGKVLGIDWDKEMVGRIKPEERLILVNDSYSNLKKIAEENNFNPVNGILLDLGMSNWHIQESGRGFSFLRDESLVMSYGNQKLTAEKIINNYSEQELEKIFREYGEERFSMQIARKIIEERKIKPIKTTFQLVEVIRKAIPGKFLHQKIHFATRVFQALRIAVNRELDNLIEVLPQAIEILESKGRLAVMSFHSLEDRIVKNFFKEKKEQGLVKILTKKPIIASFEEIKINPKARSAKLRVAEKN